MAKFHKKSGILLRRPEFWQSENMVKFSENRHISNLINTGWPKSNVSKVRAYCSASDHLIRKIFSGVCRVSHCFEEYLKIIEIGDNFFE